MTHTEESAEKLAKYYCARFSTFKELRNAALKNLVNSPYGRISNDYINAFWNYVHNKHFKS